MERRSYLKDQSIIQKLIDGAILCDRNEHGKAVPWRDSRGVGVSVALLKPVLNALLTFYPNIYPSEALIAARSGRGLRSVQRAIAVLQAKDVLVVGDANPDRGGRANKYTISVAKLRQLQVKQGSLWRQPQRAVDDEAMRRSEGTNAPRREEQCAVEGAPTGLTANKPPPSNGDMEEGVSCFDQLAEEVREFGVDDNKAVAAAVTSGCSAEQIREAIAYAGGDHGWRVPQGALRKKLLSMRPGDAVQRHFPASAAKPADDRKQAKERAAVADRGRAMALIGSMRQAGDSEREIMRVLTNLGQERFYQEPAGVPQ